MKWFYKWRYYRHQKIATFKYDGGGKHYPNGGSKYGTLFNIHIEKMRYYATKLGWMD